MMRWLLGLLLSSLVYSAMTHMPSHQDERSNNDVVKTRPHIYYCRSPNMEVFTCWWHPLLNRSESDSNVSYTLTYSMEKGPRKECPDYETGGPHSCHFDISHTSIWKMYCMEVTAHTPQGNYTSQEHCLDVAEIVEMEAPVNLTYSLDGSEEETGHTVLVSWLYPVPAHIQSGWITLVFELQYRRITEPNSWKLKGPLREPHLELLDLPVGEYVVQVRCRSRNYGHWSKWSSPLLLTVPGSNTPDKLLALILVTGVGVLALLVIGFGAVPHGKRIKAFLLPPIPKPRISGIDPLLLKKGSMDEINHHFMSLQGYRSPSYSEELWDRVSMDYSQVLQGSHRPSDGEGGGRDALAAPPPPTPTVTQNTLPASPTPYLPSPSPYCHSLPTVWAWPGQSSAQVELVSFPGSDYSRAANPAPAAAPFIPALPASDFYTCVNGLNDCGEVQLVPCLSNPVKHSSPYTQLKDLEVGPGKSGLMADCLARKMESYVGRAGAREEGMMAEQSEVDVPLLPSGTIARL